MEQKLLGAHRAHYVGGFALRDPLGLVALGLAWRMAETIWARPAWAADALIWCGATLWAFLLMAYVGKWLLRTADAKTELNDPVQSCFIGLAGVVALLASMGVSRDYRPVALGLYGFGTAWTLLFAIYQTGRLCGWATESRKRTHRFCTFPWSGVGS
jgi:tellurite resistance protein